MGFPDTPKGADEDEELIRTLAVKIDSLAVQIEKMRIADYVALLENPVKLFYLNFLGGVARGFGIAVGVTLLGAMVVYLLQRLLVLKLPVIGGFIAEIVRIVNQKLLTQ